MPSNAEDFLDDLVERIALRVVALMPQPQAAPQHAAPAEYLTTAVTAKLLGMGASTLELWRARGTGPAWHKVGATAIRYSRADLDAWLAKNPRKPK